MLSSRDRHVVGSRKTDLLTINAFILTQLMRCKSTYVSHSLCNCPHLFTATAAARLALLGLSPVYLHQPLDVFLCFKVEMIIRFHVYMYSHSIARYEVLLYLVYSLRVRPTDTRVPFSKRERARESKTE